MDLVSSYFVSSLDNKKIYYTLIYNGTPKSFIKNIEENGTKLISRKNLEPGMKELNQLIFEFKLDKNFKENDFYVSKSNIHAYKIINNWPKWEKKIFKYLGRKIFWQDTFSKYFFRKSKGIKIDASEINDKFLDALKKK